MWRKGNPPTLLLGRQIGGITMKNSIKVIQKMKYRSKETVQNVTWRDRMIGNTEREQMRVKGEVNKSNTRFIGVQEREEQRSI